MNPDTLANFLAKDIAPHVAAWELNRRLPDDLYLQSGNAQMLDLMVPTSLGGGGLSLAELCHVFEDVAAVDLGYAFAIIPHNNLALAVASHSDAAMRNRHLPGLQSGETVGAFCLTEPGAGSDAASITTTAERTATGWLLNGEKAWVTGATHATLLRVYAQTEPGSRGGGIAAFLIDTNQPGVERVPAYDMLGGHGTGTAGFSFTNVEVSEDQLFAEPGVAYRAAMDAIALARVLVGALCVGVMKGSLDTAVQYLREREAFGSPLATKQGLQWSMADVATDIEAARALVDIGARAVDDNDDNALIAAAHAKKFAARAATKRVEECMQALGANGLRHEYPLARHLAGAKMAHYLDGSTEVQNLLIAKSLFY